MKKKIQIYLEDWAIEELDTILRSDHCKNRGFQMKRGDIIEEMIANYVNYLVDQLTIPDCQEHH